MIYTSEKGILFIMTVFIIGVFIFFFYFINEAKEIEDIYDDIMQEINVE